MGFTLENESLEVFSFQEPPITAGPLQYTAPVCLGCHSPASLSGPRFVSGINVIILDSKLFCSADVPSVIGQYVVCSARRDRYTGQSVRSLFFNHQ